MGQRNQPIVCPKLRARLNSALGMIVSVLWRLLGVDWEDLAGVLTWRVPHQPESQKEVHVVRR
jgi:hypothetical protein